jgi:ABC-type transport system involved in cytochrome c biogenesis permease subunit
MMATLGFLAIIAAAVLQVVWLFRKDDSRDPASPWILAAAALVFFGITVARSFKISFVALTSTYESLLFYSAFIMALEVGYRYQKKVPFSRIIEFGATVSALAMAAIASSPLLPKDALPPIPALKSLWLVAHVALSFVGEAFFVISFAASLAFLFAKDDAKRLDFDRITYTSIAVGYPIFTAGALIFGAIWAEQAWGRWWSWDPKETWALITWLVYTLYLHVRLVMKKKDATASWISVIGFLCTVFTFFGVNYLLPGLHSYG